jgi:hypothetical protein
LFFKFHIHPAYFSELEPLPAAGSLPIAARRPTKQQEGKLKLDAETLIIISKTSSLLITRACVQVLRETIEELSALTGVTRIDGLPIPE